jgi:hypothetical protein
VRRAAAFALLLLAAWAAVKLLGERPTGRGDWSQDTAVLAESELRGGVLRLRRVRDFRYKSASEWTARWYDAEYRFDELESVWLGVEPFGFPGAAHVFLSFCFKDWRCLAVSAEIRKRRGDSFSAARGLLNAYELAYIVADDVGRPHAAAARHARPRPPPARGPGVLQHAHQHLRHQRAAARAARLAGPRLLGAFRALPFPRRAPGLRAGLLGRVRLL